VKDDRVLVLGHELRNGLTAILAAVELMRATGDGVHDRERRIIERQARRLSNLVGDLMNSARGARRKAESPPPPAAALRRHRILIVEDDRDVAEALSGLLLRRGYTVELARSATTAVRAARARPPTLVLLDLGLPGIGGHELARRFKQHESLRGARIVAVTGRSHEAERRRSLRAGFDAHLVKPVDPARLWRIVESATPPAG
jgi:CheY-like chemotaxis protein